MFLQLAPGRKPNTTVLLSAGVVWQKRVREKERGHSETVRRVDTKRNSISELESMQGPRKSNADSQSASERMSNCDPNKEITIV